MSRETEFVNGLIVKAPHENAPEYVKAKLSIRREELIAWLQSKQGEWVNADVKVSQGGKWYAAVDNWKPENGKDRARTQPADKPGQPHADPFKDDDLPPF